MAAIKDPSVVLGKGFLTKVKTGMQIYVKLT